jgi:hypothetical protein
MSRTACCFLALGISIAALAGACGDDDGDGDGPNGGSGGTGGTGGAGGTAGAAGMGMTAGSSGAAGEGAGGSGGDAGSGAGGTPNGGSSGTGAGTGGAAGSGVVETDAGPDGSVVEPEPDSGTEVDASTGGTGPVIPVDSGVNGNCIGFTTGLTTLEPQTGQEVVIARVIFNNDDDTATVVLRVVAADFGFGGGDQVVCWGGADGECSEVDDNNANLALQGTELEVVVGPGVDNDEGELIFAEGFPSNGGTPYAYVNWGDHTSEDPDGGGTEPTLEGSAVGAGWWTDGDSFDLGANNAVFADGDVTTEGGFDFCTADQF